VNAACKSVIINLAYKEHELRDELSNVSPYG